MLRLLALVLLLMVRVRQTRNREHMARLRAGEIPDQPAYWMQQEPADGPGIREQRALGQPARRTGHGGHPIDYARLPAASPLCWAVVAPSFQVKK